MRNKVAWYKIFRNLKVSGYITEHSASNVKRYFAKIMYRKKSSHKNTNFFGIGKYFIEHAKRVTTRLLNNVTKIYLQLTILACLVPLTFLEKMNKFYIIMTFIEKRQVQVSFVIFSTRFFLFFLF